MRECYTSKVLSKQACLIAKIKLEKSVQLQKLQTRQHTRGQVETLACCRVYSFYNCTDFSNFIFALKQEGLHSGLS